MSSKYDYCRDKAARPGSNFYYSILFENEEVKTTVIPLFALHNEIVDCLTASPDPGVTRLKFNWWHEELSRLSENIPRHPVTKTINSLSHKKPDLVPILHEHLITIESVVSNEQNTAQKNWLEHDSKILGRYWVALNQLQVAPDNQLIIKNGSLVFGLELLMLYPLFAAKAPEFIPAELISRHVGANDKISFPDVFGELICDYQDKLDKVYLEIKQFKPKVFIFNLVLNRLAAATCDEIIRDGNRIMEHRIQLTPIRKFWISCRTRVGV